MRLIELTAKGRYYKVYRDDEYVSQHTTEREAVERAFGQALEYPDSEIFYRHEYEVAVGLTDAGVTVARDLALTDSPPVITSTPGPGFTEGTPGVYDMTQHVSDDGLSPVTYSLINTLPQGMTFDAQTGILDYDGAGGAGTSQHQLVATDSVGQDISAVFDIVIDAVAVTTLWLGDNLQNEFGALAVNDDHGNTIYEYQLRYAPTIPTVPTPTTGLPLPTSNGENDNASDEYFAFDITGYRIAMNNPAYRVVFIVKGADLYEGDSQQELINISGSQAQPRWFIGWDDATDSIIMSPWNRTPADRIQMPNDVRCTGVAWTFWVGLSWGIHSPVHDGTLGRRQRAIWFDFGANNNYVYRCHLEYAGSPTGNPFQLQTTCGDSMTFFECVMYKAFPYQYWPNPETTANPLERDHLMIQGGSNHRIISCEFGDPNNACIQHGDNWDGTGIIYEDCDFYKEERFDFDGTPNPAGLYSQGDSLAGLKGGQNSDPGAGVVAVGYYGCRLWGSRGTSPGLDPTPTSGYLMGFSQQEAKYRVDVRYCVLMDTSRGSLVFTEGNSTPPGRNHTFANNLIADGVGSTETCYINQNNVEFYSNTVTNTDADPLLFELYVFPGFTTDGLDIMGNFFQDTGGWNNENSSLLINETIGYNAYAGTYEQHNVSYGGDYLAPGQAGKDSLNMGDFRFFRKKLTGAELVTIEGVVPTTATPVGFRTGVPTTGPDAIGSRVGTGVDDELLRDPSVIVFDGTFESGDFRSFRSNSDPNQVYFPGCPDYGAPIQYQPTPNQPGYQVDVGDGSLMQLCNSDGADIYTQGEVRQGTYSVHMEVRNSANGGADSQNWDDDGTNSTRRRTEVGAHLMQANVLNVMPYLSERWMSCSIFIPSDWDLNSYGWGPTLFQIKSPPTNPISPTIDVSISGDHWSITHRISDSDNPNTFADIGVGAGNQDNGTQVIYSDTSPSGASTIAHFPSESASRAMLADLNRGGWTDFVFHVIWDGRGAGEGGTGMIDLWMRHSSGPWVKVLQIRPGVISNAGYNGDAGCGYRVPGSGFGGLLSLYMDVDEALDATPERELYYDNFKIGNENATFEDMSPDGAGLESQDVILLHDHNTEPVSTPGVGSAAISGVWNISTDKPSTPALPDFDWSIMAASDNPLVTGQQRWQTTLTARYLDSPPDIGRYYRTERSGSGQAYERTAMISAGSGEYYAPQKLWYGFLLRVDQMDVWGSATDPEQGGGIICQWHHREFSPPDDRDPPLSLKSQQQGIVVVLEDNADNGGSNFQSPAILPNTIVGETHAIVFEILWDSRTNAEGSQGIVRVYVDDNPSPAFEWINKQNVQGDPYLDSQSPRRHPYFKWGGYRTAFRRNFEITNPDGTRQVLSYGNFAVHGEDANLEGVLQSIDFDGVI